MFTKPPKPASVNCGCGKQLKPVFIEPSFWFFLGVRKLHSGTGEWRVESECDPCKAAREIEIAAQEAAREKRQEEERFTNLLQSSGLLARELDMIQRPWDGAEEFKAPFLAWAKGTKSLYVHGVPGTGKTHAAVVALHDFISTYREPGRFYVVSDLIRNLRMAVKSHDDDRIIKEVSAAPALVLDDIAVERPTGYVLEAMQSIIDARYRRMDTRLIITSNLNFSQLAERIDDRIASRLSLMCDVYEFAGEDRRLRRNPL